MPKQKNISTNFKLIFSGVILVLLGAVYLIIAQVNNEQIASPEKETIPPLLALGFSPAEIRKIYKERQIETFDDKKRQLEDTLWEYKDDDLGFRMLQNGTQNFENTLAFAHVGDCAFRMAVYLQLGEGSSVKEGDEVNFHLEPINNIEITPPVNTKFKVKHVFTQEGSKAVLIEGGSVPWVGFTKLAYANYMSLRPKSFSDFGVITEKWLFDGFPMALLNIKDAIGCVR